MLHWAIITIPLFCLLKPPAVSMIPMKDDDGVNPDPGLPQLDLPDIDHSKMTRILKLMSEKGQDHKNDVNSPKNQYLVVAVVSAEEFQQTDFSAAGSIPESRTKVVLNDPDVNGLPSYFGGKEVHGEMLAIHFDNEIETLIGRLGDPDTGSSVPFVFVYSHYIPCAGITYIHYSCAEELANTGRINKDRYTIVVGFSTAYSNTDVGLSLQFLQEGGISRTINIANGQVYVKNSSINSHIYQKFLTNCLKEVIKDTITEIDAAFLVNDVTKKCTEISSHIGANHSHRGAYLTQYGKAVMDACVLSTVENNSTGYAERLHYNYCSAKTLSRDERLQFGRPYAMCEAEWRPATDDVNWSDLYSGMPGKSFPVSKKLTNVTELRDLVKKCSVSREKKKQISK